MSFLFLLASLVPGCSSDGSSIADAALAHDLAQPIDKAASCSPTFGSALTAGFGRIDGVVRAVVPPGHPTCAMPNGDHLVVQVDFGGATYRAVVNVLSDRGPDLLVRTSSLDAPLGAPTFDPGWHAATLDYVGTLAAHSPAFTPQAQADLVKSITDQMEIGAPISIYSSTSGGASSHLVHRNAANQDGAIVLDPMTTPRYLMFAFADQTF